MKVFNKNFRKPIKEIFCLILIGLLILLGTRTFLSKRDFSQYSMSQCIASKDCVYNAFTSISFGEEFKPNQNKAEQVIHKWQDKEINIAYYIQNNKKNILPLLEMYVSLLNYYTDIKVNFTLNNPDILVFFIKDYDFHNNPELNKIMKTILVDSNIMEEELYNDPSELGNEYESVCYVRLFSKREGNKLKKSLVFIKSTLSNVALNSCIQEEITQAMGLKNDNKELPYILYNENIKQGMNRKEVKRIFDKVYKETIALIDDRIN